MDRRVRKTRKGFLAAGTLAAVLWLLAAAGGLVWLTAADGGLIRREMMRYAPPEMTGLPEAEYAGVGTMIAGYLTGRTDSFQYVFSNAEGTRFLCFQAHEAAHMADCRELIRLAGQVCLGSAAGLAAIGTAVFLRKRKNRREAVQPEPGKERQAFGRGMLRGLGAAGIIAMAMVVWALADFDGFFTAFHRVAFDNDGWLLNPRTDLLIRLMPTAFFISLGLRGLGLWAAAGGAAAGAAFGMMHAGKPKSFCDGRANTDHEYPMKERDV